MRKEHQPEIFYADAEMIAEWKAEPEGYRGTQLPADILEMMQQCGYEVDNGDVGWYWRDIAEKNGVVMVMGPFETREEAMADWAMV